MKKPPTKPEKFPMNEPDGWIFPTWIPKIYYHPLYKPEQNIVVVTLYRCPEISIRHMIQQGAIQRDDWATAVDILTDKVKCFSNIKKTKLCEFMFLIDKREKMMKKRGFE